MRYTKTVLVHFIGPITIGALIYLIYRPQHLKVFHWINSLGWYDHVVNTRELINTINFMPKWVIASLPGGLWVYSFMFFISYIWGTQKRVEKTVFVLIVVVLSLGSELGQYLGFVPGAFCLTDMGIYTIAVLFGYYQGQLNSQGGMVV
jgi:hypothetical protein